MLALSFVLYYIMLTIELALCILPGDLQGCKDLDRIIAICQEDEESSELMETDMFTVLKSKEDYSSFLLLCAGAVRPSTVYADRVRNEASIETWITTDDEALCWVILQNSVRRWNKEYILRHHNKITNSANQMKGILEVKLTKEEKNSLPAAIYTERKVDTQRKLCGWNEEGITSFSDIKKSIEKFRVEAASETGEQWKEYSGMAIHVMMKRLEQTSPSLLKKRKAAFESSRKQKDKAVRLDSLYHMKGLSKFSNINAVAL